MDLEYLEKLMKLFEASALTELEIDEEGAHVTMSRQKEQAVAYPMTFAPQPQQNSSAPSPAAPPPPATNSKQHEVKSPIVGTFYRSPAPDADAYVQVGQQVENGTTLCIIEAMKLMNEIESDAAGKIVKILVEDGQPVEYGQVLMILE